MQAKVGNGVMVAGTATKDAEFKTIGEKNTPLTSFSLAVNKYGDPAVYVNCKAFGERAANYARGIKKGDLVCALGHVESREYEGKEYKDLNCQWLNFIGISSAGATASAAPPPVNDDALQQLYGEEIDDDDLPF